MKYSELKYKLDLMEIEHKYALDHIKMKQELAKKQLLSSCKHTWDDGSSAKDTHGNQRDYWYVCAICGTSI